MKKILLFFVVFVFCQTVFADDLFDWNLLWSGQWDGKTMTTGNLHNREDLKINILPFGLTLRGQVLDRRPLNFEPEPGVNWFDAQNFDKAITNFQGGLYHKKTDSRLLVGVLDEWGLSARIRNPWIRSPPYANNYKPSFADLKTAASGTKNDEVYLFLSTSPLYGVSGFVSTQTEIDPDIETQYRQSAVTAGIDFDLPNQSSLTIEAFHTWALLEPKKSNSWFSNPPSLPERDFKLYAAGVLFENQLLSVSSDFALSETFAWGNDIYANFGISISPLGPWSNANASRIQRPLIISLAVDGSGNRFVNRDGSNLGTAFRSAAKIEFKKPQNSLLRFSTVLRSPEFGSELFTRSSTNFYYRFPVTKKDKSPVKVSRISISMDRNADNHQKIIDRLYGYVGFSLNLSEFGINYPLGVYLNGSVRGNSASEDVIYAYPIPTEPWNFEDYAFYCEFSYSPSKYQLKTKLGYEKNAKNNEIWDFSVSGARRFKNGRVSLKVASPKLPDLWNFNISWRMEVK